MHFASDNTSGVAVEILDALARANDGSMPSYGADPLTARLNPVFSELFEHAVEVVPVATGTAANALALAQLTPPWGAVLCHEDAHVNADECGAPEVFNPGSKLIGLPGADGRVGAATLEAALGRFHPGAVHEVQPAALSLSQTTEAGTLYAPDAIAALSALAHARGLKVHMDGARFANAVAALGVPPADVTWRAGVDVLSFGATKNGAMMAEAVIFFDPALAARFDFRRKRAGHVISKARFLAAQLLAYVEDGLWLRLAGNANAMAARLAAGLTLEGITLIHPVEANEVFAALPAPLAAHLRGTGATFYDWPMPDGGAGAARFVTSFATAAEDVDAFLAAVKAGLAAAPEDAAHGR